MSIKKGYSMILFRAENSLTSSSNNRNVYADTWNDTDYDLVRDRRGGADVGQRETSGTSGESGDIRRDPSAGPRSDVCIRAREMRGTLPVSGEAATQARG